MSVLRYISGLLRASSNGRTAGSDPVDGGSSPSARAKRPARHLTLVQHDYATEAMGAEVDNEKQRYSAARYVQMQRDVYMGVVDAMTPEERQKFEARRREFERYIHGLAPDEQTAFFKENDELVAAGKLWTVLTPEEVEEARQRVLARLDEIRADAAKPMHSSPIDAAMRNKLNEGYEPTEEEADALPVLRFGEDEGPDLPAFPDIGDDHGQEEEER